MTSQGPDGPSAGCEKTLARLEERVKEGNYYEAQQMYKSTYHRFKAKHKMEDAFSVLKAGARLQLQHAQITCGSELLRMLMEGYLEQLLEVTAGRLDELCSMLAMFHTTGGADISGDETVAELRRTVGAAAKWCKTCGDRGSTRKVFAAAGATILAIQGWQGLGIATQYYVLSDDMAGLASGVEQGIEKGQPAEKDLFMARAVLQVLAVARKETMVTQLDLARDLWSRLSHGSSLPLEHFIEFLLVALGKLSQPLFDLLFSKYEASLKRDDFLWSLVDRIGSVFFGRPEPSGGLGQLLGSLLGGLE